MKKLILALVVLCGCPADSGGGGLGGAGGQGGQGGGDCRCWLPQAEAACGERSCEIVTCWDHYEDCDQNPDNGCETDLRSDDSCLSCDHSCSDGSTCESSGCNCEYLPKEEFNDPQCGQCLAEFCCEELKECQDSWKCSKKMNSWNACSGMSGIIDEDCCMPDKLECCSKEHNCPC